LVPASDGADNFVWISSPCEGFWFSVVFDDEAIDCFLQGLPSPSAAFLNRFISRSVM
jgi:hypothetical protein